ncbi:sporulation protein YunB [Defluviitalea phaphyphila]|uniref:sporulation protein YunB n=1 Tax=Defluviitalea phaphyphila TaxID=1473580 RepID=UPI0007300C10|nr:sporulation protein YunB [Defluviitalea phaphyphila]
MRRNIKGKKPKKYRKSFMKKLIIKFIALAIFILLIVISITLDRKIMPTVMTIAHIKANTITTEAISKAISDTFKEKNIIAQDLVMYDYNENGEVISWSINTPLINELSADIVVRVSKQLENMPSTSIKVPLGNLIGNSMFANIGPEINVKILQIGSAVINYDREFKSTGINQINHTVWLNIDTMIQIVIPLASDKIKVSRKVILIDKVLSGKVPPNYVDTTRDNVLDADFQDPFEEAIPFEYPSVN